MMTKSLEVDVLGLKEDIDEFELQLQIHFQEIVLISSRVVNKRRV